MSQRSFRSSRSPSFLAVVALVGLLVLGVVTVPAAVLASPSGGAANAVDSAGGRSGEALAIAAARVSGERVEVVERRSETGQVFANPSGTLTFEQTAVPVRVRRGDGWVPVDTTLAWQPDGSVAPVASAVGLRLSGGGDSPAITIAKDGQELSLSWPDRLPAPVLSGDAAAYVDVKPGVDLRVRATVDGFTQVLVVKDRASAAGLGRIAFRVATKGVSLRPADGGLTAVDGLGRSVFVPAAAMMWDTPKPPSTDAERQEWDRAGAPPRRQVRVPVALSGDELVVTPDRAMLTDSGINYPVSIDPSYFWPRPWATWMHLDLLRPSQPGWGYDQGEGVAKVGFSDWDGSNLLYRSFFQYDVSPMWGKEIHAAWFTATMNHSASCVDTPVELWLTGQVDPGTRWDNTGDGFWHVHLDTRSGHAHDTPTACGVQPDFPMELGHSARMRDEVRARTDAHGTVTLGLKAPNEGDRNQWKKFWISTAVLHIEYNSWPNPPSGLSADINLPCATGASRPVTNTSPTLSATGVDVDGDNVEMEFVWEGLGGGVVGRYRHPYQSSGARFSAVVPTGGLQDGRSYRWRAHAGDGAFEWGPWSGWCEFTFDTTKPTVMPAVSSTSFPENDLGAPVGVRGDFVFTSADPDVYGYRYGLTENTTYFVAAGPAPDRRATAPVTMWRNGPHDLYVYSVDRAGNRSDTYRRYGFLVASAQPTPPLVRGDANGDGLADIAGVLQLDANETAFLTFFSNGAGIYAPTRTWESGPNTGFRADRLQPVAGDFNGDGLGDIAVLRDEGNVGITIWVFHGNGVGYNVPAAPAWSSGANQWNLVSGRTMSGDFNGDGKSDIVNLHNYANARTKIWIFYGTSTGVTGRAQLPAWDSGENGSSWFRGREAVGDFNGDGKDDVGQFYDYGNNHTRIWIYRGTTAGITGPNLALDLGPNNWYVFSGKYLAGDFNADGNDDLGAFYDYGNGRTRLWLFRGTATNVTAPTMSWDSGVGDTWWADVKPAAGDFTGDGRADVGYFYKYANQRTKLWVLEGTASGVMGPSVLRWDSGDWGLNWDRMTSF